MVELKNNEISEVNGGSQQSYDLGHSVGSAARYFYDNVMISNRWLDHLADAVVGE